MNMKKLMGVVLSIVIIFVFSSCANEYDYNETSNICSQETITQNDSSDLLISNISTSSEKVVTSQKEESKSIDNIVSADSNNRVSSKGENRNSSRKTEVVSSIVTSKTYSYFEKEIGVYETKNLPPENEYSDIRDAWISVYSVSRSADIEEEIKSRFEDYFGYSPIESVKCTYVGKYIVNGYTDAQQVYQYTIKDGTYPLIEDEFYVVTRKICADGSPWVGFAVPCSMDNMEKSERVYKLVDEVERQLSEWTGHTIEYMKKDKKHFDINMIGEAGKCRTKDGKVLDVIYRYSRGYGVPVDTSMVK